MSNWEQAPLLEEEPGPLGFLNRGIARSFGGPVDLVSWAASPVTKALGIYNPNPLGGSQSLSDGMGAIGADVAASDAVATTTTDRVAEGVGSAAGMLVPTGVAANTARTFGGPIAQGAGNAVMAAMAKRPVVTTGLELTAGAGAGAAGLEGERIAARNDLDPSVGRIVGELVGGIGAGMAPGALATGAQRTVEAFPLTGAVLRGTKAAVAPFTSSGARVRAENRVQALSADPQGDAARMLEPGIGDLTPAQKSGNPNLMALTRSVQETAPGGVAQADDASAVTKAMLEREARSAGQGRTADDAVGFIQGRRDATMDAISQRTTSAQQRSEQSLRAAQPRMGEIDASVTVRRELDQAFTRARAQEQELWNAVPVETMVPTARARAAFRESVETLGRARQDDIPAIARQLLGDEGFADFESVREAHALYSKMRETSRIALARGNRNQSRVAGRIADAILADLDSVEDVAGPLAIARNFTRDMRQTFQQGRVGDVLGFETSGGATVEPGLTLSSSIGRQGVPGALAADEMRQALGPNNPAAEEAMRDFVRGRFDSAAAPRGVMRPGSAQDFARRNADTLERFPDLRDDIVSATDDAARADRVSRSGDAMAARLNDQRQSAGAAFVNAPIGSEADAIFKARDPARAAASLARQAAKDQSGVAMAGLKASVLDTLISRATKGDFLDGNALRRLIGDTRTQLGMRPILADDEIKRLAQIADELSAVSASQGRLPDVGSPMNDGVNSVISFLGRTFGARMGAQAGAGTSGASMLTASFGSRRVQSLMHGLTNDRAEQLIRDAVADPELFSALLAPTNTLAGAQHVERVLAAWFAGVAAQEAEGRPVTPSWALAPELR